MGRQAVILLLLGFFTLALTKVVHEELDDLNDDDQDQDPYDGDIDDGVEADENDEKDLDGIDETIPNKKDKELYDSDDTKNIQSEDDVMDSSIYVTVCKDHTFFCTFWAKKGYCYSVYYEYMDLYCKRSCGSCPQHPPISGVTKTTTPPPVVTTTTSAPATTIASSPVKMTTSAPVSGVYPGDGKVLSNSCKFPSNFQQALNNCHKCVCSYCNKQIYHNIQLYHKHLDLSTSEIHHSLRRHLPWGIPRGGAGLGGCLLTQKQYIIGYSTHLHIPLWVAYKLTKAQLSTNIKRMNCFRKDIRLTDSQSGKCSDYSRSGYDRGHMAPSGDFNYERFIEQDTYILSNIAPQSKYFNRSPGLWYKTEDLTRQWAMKYGPLYVISGTIFDMDNNGIRDKDTQTKNWLHDKVDSVPIPSHFYKILVRCNTGQGSGQSIPECAGTLESISFLLPHTQTKQSSTGWEQRLQGHITTIRTLERITGINFFPTLTAAVQNNLETQRASQLWQTDSDDGDDDAIEDDKDK